MKNIIFFCFISIFLLSSLTSAANLIYQDKKVDIYDDKSIVFKQPDYSDSFAVVYENGKLKAKYLNDYVELVPYVENVDSKEFSMTMEKESLPYWKLSKTAYEYNITTPLLKDTKSIGFKFNTSIKDVSVEGSNTIFDGKNFRIVFNFSSIKEQQYTLSDKEIKISTVGLSKVDIDPTIEFSSSVEVCGSLNTYDNVTVLAGTTLTICAKNTTGGTGFWNVSANYINVYGNISGNGKGFSGGNWNAGGQGYQGQTFNISAGILSTANNITAGGGGLSTGAGGGGANAGAGGNGGAGANAGGAGGIAYMWSSNYSGTMGGGGGGSGWDGYGSGTGGGAGGALLILKATKNITVTGVITLNGSVGGSGVDGGNAGGGGGAGGTITLFGNTINITNGRVYASGGDGGAAAASHGIGGGGGGGRINLIYGTLNNGTLISVAGGAVGNVGTVGVIYYQTFSFPTNSLLVLCNETFFTQSIVMNLLNETSPFSSIFGTMNTYLEYSSGSLNFSAVGNNQNLCIYPPEANLTISNSQTQYSATGYSHREYNFDNYVADNATDTLNLYLLPEGSCSRISITVKDQYSNTKPGVIVKIMRWYPELNSYKVVAAPKTDSNGVTNTYLIAYDVEYAFQIWKDGVQLQSIDKQKITTDTLILLIQPAPVNYYPYYWDKMSGNVVYDDAAGTLTGTYADTSGFLLGATMYVNKISALEKANLCTIYNTSKPLGSFVCDVGNISSSIVGVSIVANLTDGEVNTIYSHTFNEEFYVSKLFGNCKSAGNLSACKEGLFITLFLVVMAVMIGTWNPSVSIIFMFVALGVTIQTGLYAISTSTFIGLVFVGLIMIWRMRN